MANLGHKSIGRRGGEEVLRFLEKKTVFFHVPCVKNVSPGPERWSKEAIGMKSNGMYMPFSGKHGDWFVDGEIRHDLGEGDVTARYHLQCGISSLSLSLSRWLVFISKRVVCWGLSVGNCES